MSEIENASGVNDGSQPDSGDTQTPAAPKTGVDEHHGLGGSYLRDPLTGERVLIQRTKACTSCQA